ncbi:hypothetical protein MXL54_08385 [Enterobacteriaceae bacterium G50]|nr:hypothetical protein [Enterobacteriaceae bacterium G50]
MLNSELIQDESEFKAVCKTYGDQAIKICKWLQQDYKEKVFSAEKGESAKLIHIVNNIDLIIRGIENANTPYAPTLEDNK